MTIEEWIQGKVGFALTANNISAILVDREVTPGVDASTVPIRTRELCWADALTIYLSKDSKSRTDGGTTESESISGFSKDEIKSLAIWLYEKNGESIPIAANTVVKDASHLWGANGIC
jgi:hypothetical protein